MRHHFRYQQRVRLRLPPRQYGHVAPGHGAAQALLCNCRRGRLRAYRRRPYAAHHLRSRPQGRRPDVQRIQAQRGECGPGPAPPCHPDSRRGQAENRKRGQGSAQGRRTAAFPRLQGSAEIRPADQIPQRGRYEKCPPENRGILPAGQLARDARGDRPAIFRNRREKPLGGTYRQGLRSTHQPQPGPAVLRTPRHRSQTVGT